MIKLKTLILEGHRPTISKQEEDYALQVMREKLLPGIVKAYNDLAKGKWNVPVITLDEVRKQLKKLRIEDFTNGQLIEYGIKLIGTTNTISLRIQKLNHGRKHGKNEDTITFEVGYYDFGTTGWGDLGWTMYGVNDLVKGAYDPNPISWRDPVS